MNDSRGSYLTNRASSFTVLSAAILILTVVLSNGCGIYNDLTTYYNTFYNAKHLFADAVDEVNKSPQKDRDTNYFAAYVVPQGSATKFDSVIVKCSKVIQYHADSKYVPDAIFMIAQCYYYEKENESAIKKFQELINNFPKDDNVIPAKLWFAKTEYLDKKPDAAMTIIDALVPEAHDAGKKDVELEAMLLKAQIYVDRKDYDLAADEYGKALETDGDGSLKALAQYQLASSYEIIEKYDKAADAYKNVLKYDADQDLQFKSQYHYGTMLATSGKYTPALNLFNELKSDRPKNEDLALIDLEIAKTYAMMDDTAKAFDFFRFIDTTYRGTPALDKSYYERGLLFEYRYKDLKTALGFYSKVTGQGLSVEKASFSKQKAANFTHYFTLLGNLTKCDSMLHPELYKKAVKDTADSLGGSKKSLLNESSGDTLANSDETLRLRPNPRDTIANRYAMPLPSPSVAQSDNEKLNAETLKVTRGKPDELTKNDSMAIKVPDSTRQLAQQSKQDVSGNLLKPPKIAEPNDSGLVLEKELVENSIRKGIVDSSFVSIDTSKPNFAPPDVANKDVPDNILQEKLAMNPRLLVPDSLLKSGRHSNRHELGDDDIVKGRNEKKPGAKNDTSVNVAKPAVPSVITPDSVRRLIVKTEFELAGTFFLELHMPDSAVVLYEKIIQDTNGTRYVPGSLYALSELYRMESDSVATDSLYNIILDKYPKSEFAHKIKKNRGVEDLDLKKNPADTVFAQVASLIDDKKGMDAITLLQNLVETGDTATVVPKALYTIGWIYENVLVQNDSATSAYKVLLKKYPTSIYAIEANPRVAVKEDSTKLSQYVKVNEVQTFGKTESHKKSKGSEVKKGERSADDENGAEPDDEDMQNIRKGNRDVNEDSDLDDTDDSTDDNSDINN
jgi:tetratricopeptide (TPR) repeat protein